MSQPYDHVGGPEHISLNAAAVAQPPATNPNRLNNFMLCPFCSLPDSRIVQSNDIGFVIRDAYAISPGHTLVIPKRHVGSFFDLTDDERASLFALLTSAKEQLNLELQPSAFNIGINDGAAAGQTVPHLHIHLIPRFAGDRADPRGGVRWIIPEKADYWSQR